MKKNKQDLNSYENIYSDEYIENFKDELSDADNYVELEDEEPKKNNSKIKKIINIIFIVLMCIMIMIATDVICVARYNVGPFFAIRTSVYNDGGTKVYYGLGYKVIKYHQVQGRRDKQIGFWTMPYSIEPTTISDIDLAINFNDDNKTYEKYYKQFLRINTNIKNINLKKNTLTLGYNDEGGKYTLDIICKMAQKDSNIKQLKIDKDVTIIGTLVNFKAKSKNNVNTIYINDCFAEQ